jgi:hypothetical protein
VDPKGMRLLEMCRDRWRNNIKMDIRKRMLRYGLDSYGSK